MNFSELVFEITDELTHTFSSLQFESHQWEFVDFRIMITLTSFGSDAINPQTQYSNPIAILQYDSFEAIGASFTLGEGNHMVCEAADLVVRQLEGVSMSDLIASEKGFYESITNPLQLRWQPQRLVFRLWR
jgi:L-fuconate dehydratase